VLRKCLLKRLELFERGVVVVRDYEIGHLSFRMLSVFDGSWSSGVRIARGFWRSVKWHDYARFVVDTSHLREPQRLAKGARLNVFTNRKTGDQNQCNCKACKRESRLVA